MLIEARCNPSTKTFTVPSGSFNNCNTFATVPKSNKSSFLGSSTDAFFCVINIIRLSPAITFSSAFTDLSLPTKSGTTMCGNTTISLRGNTGILFSLINESFLLLLIRNLKHSLVKLIIKESSIKCA